MPETRLPDADAAGARVRAAFAARALPPPAASVLRPEAASEGASLREALASLGPDAAPVSVAAVAEGKLWMLEAETFRYHLPALLLAVLADPAGQSPLAAELIEALTLPERSDIEARFDRIDEAPVEARLDPVLFAGLRGKLLADFDEGRPARLFRQRCDALTDSQGAAVLAVLRVLAAQTELAYLGAAIAGAMARYWHRFEQPRQE
jgi:hypothetical protein